MFHNCIRAAICCKQLILKTSKSILLITFSLTPHVNLTYWTRAFLQAITICINYDMKFLVQYNVHIRVSFNTINVEVGL